MGKQKNKPTRNNGSANKNLFSFRKYKKVEGGKNKKGKHPKLIVDENKTQFGFMGLTESRKRGHHKNIELSKNPEKGNFNPAYIRKELRYDDKENFYERLKNYNLSEKDKQLILKYLEKSKKKK